MHALLRPTLLSAVILAAASTHAAAQQTPVSPPSRASTPAEIREVEWSGDLPQHFEGIALTDTQKARIVELQKRFHGRMDALRDSAKAAGVKPDDAELRKRLGGLMAEEHEAFKALLDEAGRRRFDENMARMHAGSGHGAAGHSGHGASQGSGKGTTGRPPAR